ncbi:MAG: threonine--tRNA ligase [Firmicutes bacterium]|nr:threonine--tRNA ligase [Alicyclobacillaceae bacterium]MCL6497616.1 threonine--tRNA ligase [Bacillota bacterium]
MVVGKAVYRGRKGSTVAELGISPPDEAVAFSLNGHTYDFQQGIRENGRLSWLTFQEEAGRLVFRHSGAHLLAQAVKRLWPEAQLGTGPATEEGFYYDIRLPKPLGESDLQAIEAEMQRIAAEDLPIERVELGRTEALQLFAQRQEPFKVDIIQRIPEGVPISAYRQGEFIDLCAGPHVPRTGRLKAVKLTGVSGAYWRGDEANPMLTRIYGTAYPDAEGLTQYLYRVEEAKRRDHRRLGPALGLYLFREEAPGFTFWLPKGQRLYRTLEEFSRRLQEPRGYQEVATPWIYRVGLWQQSGHWDHYRENMFVIEREDEKLGVKPMNCPGHCLLYQSAVRSYRDLPLRLAEYGPLSRFERSGTLHGLMRVRGLHQDDAHLFVREDQIAEEMRGVLELVDLVYRTFGMPYEVVLSTRPDDYLGSLEIWERAEGALQAVLEAQDKPYQIHPKDGAFYGPKLDFYAVDALGRRWQCATAQLDFQLPLQFDLTYIDRDGQPKRPVMIHRAIFGSIERFLGILVEHYGGDFPLWLAPVQVRVVPITDAQGAYAEAVAGDLRRAGLRVEVDARNQKLAYKVREAEVDKIPVLLVVGRRDVEQGTVSVRIRPDGDIGARPWPAYLAELAERARMPVG